MTRLQDNLSTLAQLTLRCCGRDAAGQSIGRFWSAKWLGERLFAGLKTMQKETIILVHGTFAAPQSEKAQWYEIADTENFVTKLNENLEKRASDARCWAHLPSRCWLHLPDEKDFKIFSWSGRNSWIDRAEAAKDLATYLTNLIRSDWRCHIVAHSHGGNVAIDALAQLENHRGIASVVTLGTPFLSEFDEIKRIQQRRMERGEAINMMLFWIFISPLVYLGVKFGFFSETLNELMTINKFLTGMEPAIKLLLRLGVVIFVIYYCVPILIFGPLAATMKFFSKPQGFDWSSIRRKEGPFILAMNSGYDEAWQLLRNFYVATNPFDVETSFFRFIFDQRRSSKYKSRIVARTLGTDYSWKGWALATMLFMVCANIGIIFIILFAVGSIFNWEENATGGFLILGVPFFLFGFGGIASKAESTHDEQSAFGIFYIWKALLNFPMLAGSLLTDCITYFVRKRMWLVMQDMCFGQAGFPSKMRGINKVPSALTEETIIYENLPSGVEVAALESRAEWLSYKSKEVGVIFAQFTLAEMDIKTLLKEIETDLTLVHATYYTNDNCIERIADWIAAHR